MEGDNWQRVKQIFADALERSPDERGAFVSEACQNDLGMRYEVEALLEADDQAEAACPEPTSEPKWVGRRIGKYRLQRILGEGGMGVVYLAEQEHPRRNVALKLIKGGLVSPALRQRFKHEAGALGRLHHPGIVQVHEAGTVETELGEQPFVAMEFAPGQTLTEYAKQASLSPRDCMTLMARIADAVHHAHQQGVIHRDLKPANILVDADGQPKIFDFGVARLTDADTTLTTMHTHTGQVIGTLPYMSPEQASGNPDDVDIRCDVYALGVLTYQLLSGRLPHVMHDRMVFDALRMIREEVPLPLSSIDTKLRGDIDTIVGKALEKDKTLRYDSAAAFASDIRRFLHDEPITARPPSTWYLLQKFAKRNRALVIGVAAVLVVLIAGVVVATTLAVIAEDRRQEAEDARTAETEQRQLAEADRDRALAAEQQAEAVTDFLVNTLQEADPASLRPHDITIREMFDNASELLYANALDRQPLVRARLFQTVGLVYSSIGSFEEAARHLRTCIEMQRQDLPQREVDLAHSLYHLAVNHFGRLRYKGHSERDYSEAIVACRQALAVFTRRLGPDDEATMAAKELEGKLLWRTGDIQGAWESMVRILVSAIQFGVLDVERFPDELVHTLETTKELWPKDRQGAAEVMARYRDDAIEKLRHLWQAGERDHAREYIRIHYVPFTNTFWHSTIPFHLGSAAKWLRSLGADGDVVEPILLEAIDLRRDMIRDVDDMVGDDDFLISSLQTRLAELFKDESRDLDRAEQLARKGLKYLRKEYVENPEFTNTLYVLGTILIERGKHAEAQDVLRQCLDSFTDPTPGDARRIAETQAALGSCLTALGRHEEAEALLVQAIDEARRIAPADNAFLGCILAEYGASLIALERFFEAETALSEAYTLVTTSVDPTGTQATHVIGRFMDLYQASDRQELAAEWRARLEKLGTISVANH